jgi:hypothetical protein
VMLHHADPIAASCHARSAPSGPAARTAGSSAPARSTPPAARVQAPAADPLARTLARAIQKRAAPTTVEVRLDTLEEVLLGVSDQTDALERVVANLNRKVIHLAPYIDLPPDRRNEARQESIRLEWQERLEAAEQDLD